MALEKLCYIPDVLVGRKKNYTDDHNVKVM